MGGRFDTQGFLQGFQNFMQNRAQYIAGIPKDMQDDPNKIIQHMMNGGRISQKQYNFAQSFAQQIQSMYRK